MIAVVPLAGTWIETYHSRYSFSHSVVVPLAGTWIETLNNLEIFREMVVVPLAGTWIETISSPQRYVSKFWSFPLRERGLKRVTIIS